MSTEWGTNDSFYDEVEWSQIHWLRDNLQPYLDFHEAQRGHLPGNFEAGDAAATLGESDARANGLHEIGFVSYSLLVNLIAAKRTVDRLPSTFSSIIEVYEHTSSFFLRIGAAIDLSEHLERKCARLYTGTSLVKGPAPAPSAYDHVTAALAIVDTYNNYLKHNGLPAAHVQRDASGAIVGVEVPSELHRGARYWGEQRPDEEISVLLRHTLGLATAAFSTFYRTLHARTAERLENWKIKPKVTSIGIMDMVASKTVASGALDGYQGHQVKLP